MDLSPFGYRLFRFALACLLATALPLFSVKAHKVSAVSVITEIDTAKLEFKIELAMDVEPTGDPSIDDVITPEQAARTFATEALKIYFDDQAITAAEPEIRIVTESDEQTPEELRRQKAVATVRGSIPNAAVHFLMFVTETTEAAVVMHTIKDGVPGRRLQVLYPGEFSTPVALELPETQPEPVAVADSNPEPENGVAPAEPGGDPENGGTEPQTNRFLWIGLGTLLALIVAIVAIRSRSSRSAAN